MKRIDDLSSVDEKRSKKIQYDREYYQRNKSRMRKNGEDYYKKNADTLKKYAIDYYYKNIKDPTFVKKIRMQNKKGYYKNRDSMLEWQKSHYKKLNTLREL